MSAKDSDSTNTASMPTLTRRVGAKHDVKALQQALQHRYGVDFCFLGMKQIKDRPTRRTSLICAVTRKKNPDRLKQGERIPKTVSKTLPHGEVRRPTDVIEVRSRFRFQTTFNPGDSINGGGANATIGAFGTHAQLGQVFVTAGHFAQDAGGDGVSVLIRDVATGTSELRGTIALHEVVGGIDYSLIEPASGAGESAANLPIDTIYEPSLRTDIGKPVFVLTRGRALRTVCRGLFARITIPFLPAPLDNMILTDPVTAAGDSGAALVDSEFRLWGLLVGIFNNAFSVFMPITELLARQPIRLGD